MSSINTTKVKAKSVGGVQSLEIGLTVLDILINQNEPMMLKDIAHATQMHPAKVHRYLVSLIRKEFASKTTDGRYGLGVRVNTLGHAGLNQNNILERLGQVAIDIRDTLNCGVQIAKWFNEGPIVIQSIEPNTPISIITRIGSRMPLATSATGRLFASYLPNSMIKPILFAEWQTSPQQSVLIRKAHPSTLHNDENAGEDKDKHKGTGSDADDNTNLASELLAKRWDEFVKMQDAIRHQGYATVTGDMLMGVSAISIPVMKWPIRHIDQSHDVIDDAQSLKASADKDSMLEYAITVIGTTEQLPLASTINNLETIRSIAKRHQII